MKTVLKTALLATLIAVGTGSAMAKSTTAINTNTDKKMVTDLLGDLAVYQADEQNVAQNIQTFDNLDFDVFTNQKWDRLHESHSKNIVVHWPDGHTTKGIDTHIADLKAMFVYAPDTRILTHPIKFGKGEWTAVVGVMEGTFTKPMPIGNGKSIEPTGKSFTLNMATVSHWNGDTMDEEYLFWDNATYMKQLGVSQ